MSKNLPEAVRKTVFADLVAAQDEGLAVRESRYVVGRRHNLGVDEVRRIEREGLDHEWPPL